jgi:hypothetical protein
VKSRLSIQGRFKQAHAFQRQRKYGEARRAWDDLLHTLRDNWQIKLNSAACDVARGEPALAVPVLVSVVEEYPAWPAAWETLANAYKVMGDWDAAAVAYRRVLAFAPQRITPLVQLAGVRSGQGDVPEAASLFLQAATMQGESGPGEQFNRGLARLMLGMYGDGFTDYEKREEAELVRCEHSKAPVWDGQPTEGTVCLLQEQGYGDTIQMLRFLPRVVEKCGGVILCVPKPLVALCEGQFAGVRVVEQLAEDYHDQDEHHFRLLPMSLPHVVGNEGGLSGAPYLTARGLDLLPPRIQPTRVAITWKGNPQQGDDKTRSIPLQELVPLFQVPGVEWVSVQVGATEEERALLLAHGVRDMGPLLTDFSRTASVLHHCDLVVSVCTSVVHLAGALGRPCYLLKSATPEWRWGLSGDRSPWYDSVRVRRQERVHDWIGVIAGLIGGLH